MRDEAREAGSRLEQAAGSAVDTQRREQKRLADTIESLKAELAASKKQLEEALAKVPLAKSNRTITEHKETLSDHLECFCYLCCEVLVAIRRSQ